MLSIATLTASISGTPLRGLRTRPLGASIGDYLSQSAAEGGLGLGPTVTSLISVVGILGIVTYLSLTRADVIPTDTAIRAEEEPQRGAMVQTVVVVTLILVAGATGYTLRKAALQDDTAPTTVTVPAAPGRAPAQAPAAAAPLGDVSNFRVITQDTLNLLDGGDQSGATTRIADLETEWDNAQARLKPKNAPAWTTVDGKIDTVLRELRATTPKPAGEKAALTALLTTLG